MKELTQLTVLSLRGCGKVTDEGLTALKDLKHLNWLDLHDTKVTGSGFQDLKDLKNLYLLELGYPEMTGKGLKGLKELKQSYPHTHHRETGWITDEVLVGLGENGVLHLLNYHVGGGDGRPKDDESIRHLDLSSTEVTDAGLKGLKGFKRLATLNLSGRPVTDEGVKELKELTQLTTLNLSNTDVTGCGPEGCEGSYESYFNWTSPARGSRMLASEGIQKPQTTEESESRSGTQITDVRALMWN